GTAAAGSSDSVPLRQMSDGSSHVLGYLLYQDSGYLTIWGNDSGSGKVDTANGQSNIYTVYGKIPGGQNVPAGSYGDTVHATVIF
ncbi:MAG: Csu type fimbrial protein, partial [Nostoc sp.]